MSLWPPKHIYTADIEAFYPNTPHTLILDIFKHYNPLLRVNVNFLPDSYDLITPQTAVTTPSLEQK